MRLIITGGHIGPALAVIDQLPLQTEILFIGRKTAFEGDTAVSYEYSEITKRNIPFHVLKTGRMQRRFSRHTISSLLKSPLAIKDAHQVIKAFQPDVVLTFGGYLSLPVGIAASILAIPLVIHEQTLSVGLANKLLAKFAQKICISWQSSSQFFPKNKTICTGIPLRSALFQKKTTTNKELHIYITGGSSGSHFINSVVQQVLPEILPLAFVTHQTGNAFSGRDYEMLKAYKKTLPGALQKKYNLVQFLSDIEAAQALQKADLVICRSGINTVSELLYLAKPALCIPLPSGQKGEQERNARFLAANGLAEVLLQDEVDKKMLFATIEKMIKHLDTYNLKKDHAPFFIDGAADRIITVLSDVVNQTSNKKT